MPTNILQCGSSVSNITESQCTAKYGVIESGFLSFEQKSDTFANVLTESTWTSWMNETASTRVYVLPSADDAIRNQEDPVFFEGNLSKRRQIRKGRTDIALEYHDKEDCVWEVAKTFNGQRMYFAARTENEAIIAGKTTTNMMFVPVDIFTSDPIPSENKDEPWRIIIYVFYVETIGNFDYALLPDDETFNTGTLWKPSSKQGIKDVTISEDSVTATTVVLNIQGACDREEITTLVTDDFDVRTGGSPVVVTVTNVGNVYTISGLTTATVYDITLKNQPTMTTKGYEAANTLQSTTS